MASSTTVPTRIAAYNLGSLGVVLTKNPYKGNDGELALAQNAVPDVEGGYSGLRKRPGLLKLNGTAAGGAVFSFINVPISDPTCGVAPSVTPDPDPELTNTAPVVSAGADETLSLSEEGIAFVVLDGSASDDGLPVGSTLVSQWTQTSGPATMVFVDEADPATTAIFYGVGTYVLRLTSSDSLLITYDEVTITVNAYTAGTSFVPTVETPAGAESGGYVYYADGLDGLRRTNGTTDQPVCTWDETPTSVIAYTSDDGGTYWLLSFSTGESVYAGTCFKVLYVPSASGTPVQWGGTMALPLTIGGSVPSGWFACYPSAIAKSDDGLYVGGLRYTTAGVADAVLASVVNSGDSWSDAHTVLGTYTGDTSEGAGAEYSVRYLARSADSVFPVIDGELWTWTPTANPATVSTIDVVGRYSAVGGWDDVTGTIPTTGTEIGDWQSVGPVVVWAKDDEVLCVNVRPTDTTSRVWYYSSDDGDTWSSLGSTICETRLGLDLLVTNEGYTYFRENLTAGDILYKFKDGVLSVVS